MVDSVGKRGRPPRHQHRADNPIQIAAVSMTLNHIKKVKGWDNNNLRLALKAFGDSEPKIPSDTFFHEFKKNYDFDFRSEQISLVCQGEIKNDDVFKAIYLWLKSNSEYDNLLTNYIKGAELNSKEPFVKSARNILGFDDPLDQADADLYAGVYQLYRPFFRNPTEQIILCRLEIGGESAFDCNLTSIYFDRVARTHKSRGKIVLHGSDNKSFSAITSGPGPSKFMMHFDYLNIEEDGLYEMGGNMIASYGSDPSSAWPMFAIKSLEDEAWEPKVIDGGEFQNLPEQVRERLDRGAIYWRPDQFPRPFSRKFTS